MIEMATNDLEMLKADLKAEILKELTGQDLRAAKENPKPLLELWKTYRQPLYEKFGPGTYFHVWECIRKLAVYRSGHRYIRDLLPSEEAEAADFAESLLEQMGIEKEE